MDKHIEMSSSSEVVSWVDNWWPLLVILFGLLFLIMLVTFSPTT
jgi:steroid 5-alpha reductase family enzyme